MIPPGLAPLAALWLFVAAGCPSGPRSGIAGVSVIGPTRPSVRVDGNAPDVAPYPSLLLVLSAADRHPVARITTDARGAFAIDLPPGDYLLSAPSAGERSGPRILEERVQVSTGTVSRVTVRFDIGLR